LSGQVECSPVSFTVAVCTEDVGELRQVELCWFAVFVENAERGEALKLAAYGAF
jgi:hypothetical protein